MGKKLNKKNDRKVLIRNMVCQRCIMSVESIFQRKQVPVVRVSLGEVELPRIMTTAEQKAIEKELRAVGFELIETRINKIVDDIKQSVMEYLATDPEDQKLKLSTFIASRLSYEYSYLSDLFSSVEGKTIEQFFLLQRIEKVKELLVYDQRSLTEISYQTGFSSVHHLSAQFKKLTGLTPSHFKKIGASRRRSIDQA